MKFSFYNAIIYKNGEPTNIDISPIIDHIRNQPTINRTLKIKKNQEQDFDYFSMPAMRFDDKYPSERCFWLGKFLDSAILEASFESDSIKELEGNAYLPSIIFYDDAYHLLVLQSAMHGVTAKIIEQFFNAFFDNGDSDEETDTYELRLFRQRSETGLNLIKADTKILSVNLSIKTSEYDDKTFFTANDGLLVKLMNIHHDISKQQAVPEFSLTFKQKNYSGDIKHGLIDMIKKINANDPALAKGEVKVKYKNGNTDTILLNANLFMTNEMVMENNGFDYLSVRLTNKINHNSWIKPDCKLYLTRRRQLPESNYMNSTIVDGISYKSKPNEAYIPKK